MTTFTMKNSSCTFNASASCCISRNPPSPDGEPSRPAPATARPKPGIRMLSKDHIPTWKTIQPSELRAIFEEEASNGAEQMQGVRHKGTAVFREMLALEDDSESDKDSVKVKPKKSSNTLIAVTRKLKKHLSRESALNKRHSRSSIGTSEEEVERRAELRRIRQKRIQEELSHEGHFDDDAKSISSEAIFVAPTPPPTAKKSHSPWTPGTFVPLPLLTPPALPLPRLSFPHLSPLEMRSDPFHEAYLTEGSTTTFTPRRWSNPESSITRVNSNTSGRTLSRRYSSPYFAEWEVKNTELQIYVPSRKSSCIPPMPPQPTIQPTRLPSIALPARSSWRLSFATDNRGDNLRKLSLGHIIPVTLDPAQLRPSSPPGRSLHSPGLRLSSQVIISSDETGIPDSLGSRSETYSEQDFGGVDGGGDGSATIHLHEMGISQRLASRGLQNSTSSPQLPSNGSRQRYTSNRSESTQIHTERSRFMRNTTDSAPLSERIPQSWGQVVSCEGSSVYPSGDNSPQASRQSSRFNLFSLLSGSKNKIGAAEYQELVSLESHLNLLTTPTANLSSTSLTIPLMRFPHRSNVDDSSLLASETSSFREREAELSVVQTRFASVEARRASSTPVSSKFREEFSSETGESSTPQHRRSSTVSKLTKLAIRTYDGAKLEELLDIPVPKFDPHQLKTPTPQTAALLSPFSPLMDDEAVNVWGNVLKKTADEKAHEVGNNLQLPRKRSSNASRKKSTIEDELPRSVFGNFTQLGKSKKKQVQVNHHKSAAEEYNERFQERIAVKELVMDSWEEEMAATAARAQAKSRNIVHKTKPAGPDKRYPATWSRYPSHTRSERSISAGATHKVEVKDFAVLGHEEDGEIVWCLEHDDEGHHSVIDDPNLKGLRHKVKERVRHKAYKVDTSQRQAYHTSGRRGSLTIANQLEYPELEILPITLLTAEEMNARHKEEEMVAHEKAKDEELDDLMMMFGRGDGTSEMSGQHYPSRDCTSEVERSYSNEEQREREKQER
ncbi:uncharacterized protein LY89DRAFT_221629 [Mollisia scopiformis]|uniref:Uncharacterized protein n=1 Tax=Mollisia scopiformis TaxID=149040 RepID=A0A194WVT7_MOLSC|nr:uncharacterized protein LY89DRAFT_221629 [Mollisia scopiformis]KUJ12083.1 hypothetical protein LY89DRAFT_221629 [Mollisia scopiformis]